MQMKVEGCQQQAGTNESGSEVIAQSLYGLFALQCCLLQQKLGEFKWEQEHPWRKKKRKRKMK